MNVVYLMSLAVSAAALYFGLRAMLKSIKYDTAKVREWSDGPAQRQLRDLHEWHDTRDSDGRFKWVVNEELSAAIISIAKSQEELAFIVRHMNDRLEQALNVERQA